jgi:predicted transcriptional regulator
MKRVRDCAYLIVKIWACCERIENVLTSMQKKPSRNYEYEKAPKQRSRLHRKTSISPDFIISGVSLGLCGTCGSSP